MPPVIGMSRARQASASAFDRLDELPHDLGALGIAEVQAVGAPIGSAPAHATLRAASATREHGAAARIQVAVAAIAVGRHRERALVPLMRTTPAPMPARTIELVRTMWSYWRYTQRLLATVGEPRIASRASRGAAALGSPASRASVPGHSRRDRQGGRRGGRRRALRRRAGRSGSRPRPRRDS